MSGKQSKLLVFWAVLFVLSLFFIFGSLDTSPYTISFPPIDSQEPTGEPESGELVEEADFNVPVITALL